MNKKNKKERWTKAEIHRTVIWSALSLFLFLFLVSFISAQPGRQVSTAEKGYDIFVTEIEFAEQNTALTMHIHVSNKSDGEVLTNNLVDCFVHAYNSTNKHTFESRILEKESNGLDHEFKLSPGNLSDLGLHSMFIWCNGTFAGDERVFYEVTPSGKGGTTNIIFIVFLIVVIYVITLLGFFKEDETITLLGGMFMIFLGAYLLNNGVIIYRDTLTLYFSYFTIALGAIATLVAVVKWIEEM